MALALKISLINQIYEKWKCLPIKFLKLLIFKIFILESLKCPISPAPCRLAIQICVHITAPCELVM